jgi:hypothetical protein
MLHDRQCTYKVTLWGVHVTIVTVQIQQFILRVLLSYVTADSTKLLSVKQIAFMTHACRRQQ